MRDDPEHISRSRKKRDSSAAQRLGETLAKLSRADRAALRLPPDVEDAIEEWRHMPSREAKRRQMQYVGRLMRDLDGDDIRGRLEALLAPSRAETASLHALEAVRDKLVNASGQALETELAALAARFPDLKVAHMRHLAETAAREREGGKPPKAYRELFRLLKKATETDESP